MRKREVEKQFADHGFDDYRWIGGKDVIVRQWVRFKCLLMCSGYAQNAVCPPNMPPVEQCRQMFSEYDSVAILRKAVRDVNEAGEIELFAEVDDNLLALERALFFEGYYKVMALPMTICYRCPDCTRSLEECRKPLESRPTPEALGVDVFETVRNAGYPIEVLRSHDDLQNRYALLLVE
ncbi:MAG: DUF2284 domain-containing protein [Bacillota bacterium]